MLTTHAGNLTTRSEIARRLWSSEVFVDAGHGINTAIRKLSYLLRDNPDAPTFIQTVTGIGYRFIATVEVEEPVTASATPPLANVEESQPAPSIAGGYRIKKRVTLMWTALAVASFGALLTTCQLRYKNFPLEPGSVITARLFISSMWMTLLVSPRTSHQKVD